MKKSQRYSIAAVLAFSLAAAPLWGQVDTGSFSGVVRDASGAVIPAAKVRFIREATGVETFTVAGQSGDYVSPPLRPGAYTIRAEAAGFRSGVAKATLELNQRATLEFKLEVGVVTESVNVEATVTLLEAESSTVSTLQNEQAVKSLPLNTRNFNQLIGLSAGVMPAQTQAGNLAITAARGTTANAVNGIGFRSNNYRVDGVDNTEHGNSQGILIYPPVEAIQEFRLQTSVPSAEFGRGGATINVAYKSGGRSFNGNLFEFFRNDALDARNFFDRTGKPAPIRMNQFGGTLGGPVLLPGYNQDRSKTFFFFSWEAERRVQGITSLVTVPTAAYKRGDFSTSNLRVYDPLTSRTVDGRVVRDQFAGNVMPASRLDKVGSNVMNLFPDPNQPGLVANYGSSPNQTVERNNYDIKIDHAFSAKDQTFFRYSQHHTQMYNPGPLPKPAIGSTDASDNLYPLYQFVGSYTRTLSPSAVNEFRAAATRLNLGARHLNWGVDLAEQLGIPGVNGGGDPLVSGMPTVNLAGYPSLGDSGFRPAIIALNSFQFNDIVSVVTGKHTLRMGGEYLRRHRNKFQSSAIHGILNLGPIYSTNPASPAGTGISLADLLLGAAASGNIAYLNGTVGLRRTDYALFIQDTWKLSNALTLNIGLRWDYFGDYPSSEVADRIAYFRPDLNGVFGVNTAQIPWGAGVSPDRNNIGPRIGLAYKLNEKTVVRAGWGLMFSPDPGATLGEGNPPFAGSVAFTNDQFNYAGARRLSQGFQRPTTDFSPIGSALAGVDPYLQAPYATQFNFTVARDLPSRILLTTAYVGTTGRKLQLQPNLNQARPGPGTVASRRPYPLYNDISWVESSGASNYHSLQMTAEKRLSGGVGFLASYTWSHAIDNGSYVASRQDFNNLRAERGNADIDVRQRFVLSGMWEVPVGRGRTLGKSMPKMLDLLAGGWQINGIASLYEGLWFTPTSAVNTLNGSGTQRPDRISNGNLPAEQRTIQRWFDIGAFTTPGQFVFGNAGRDILEGPGTMQFDGGISKSFTFQESPRRYLEFRAEMFNLANRAQFNNPNAAIGSAPAGIITSAGSPSTFQRTSRQIQMVLKLYF